MILLVLRESFTSFKFNRGLEKAATLSFYGFFAMIPLLLIVLFLTSSLIASSERALKAIGDALAQFSPLLNRVIISEVITVANQRAWSVVSLVVLFWSITPLTAAIRSAFSAIFRADHPLKWWQAKLRDAVAMLMMLVLLVVLVAGTTITSLVEAGWFVSLPFTFHILSLLTRLLIAVACAALFYVALAPIRLRLTHLFAGAFMTTFLLGLIGPLFGLILRFNPNYGYAFGSLKTIFLLFMWVYYSFAAVLFATEVMANIRRREVLVLRELFLPNRKRPSTLLLNRFTHAVPAGDTVFNEGDRERHMYYVAEGSVVLGRGDRVLKEVGPGEYFGEMAMLIDAPRTATAKAGTHGATLVRVSNDNYELVLRENPKIVLNVLREMAARLKHTTDQLEAKA